jgi:hypothetical protein
MHDGMSLTRRVSKLVDEGGQECTDRCQSQRHAGQHQTERDGFGILDRNPDLFPLKMSILGVVCFHALDGNFYLFIREQPVILLELVRCRRKQNPAGESDEDTGNSFDDEEPLPRWSTQRTVEVFLYRVGDQSAKATGNSGSGVETT